ncbi:hypothetical protein [Kocuria turfanensis]|uniref:Uncharacterized protein n=1 Tax=Kocuria turfanensis TaxID=388357 RepID=A0A512IBY3_9MICC|nr:hypothetical protein [Kocuria turfanensis]GEO95212.1 hypothetical protein KTU01_13350 [Kocuria turfanensis]
MNIATDDLTREARLRRAAKRQGLTLHKARTRTPEHPAWGTYGLYDGHLNYLVAGNPNTGFGLSLEDVETALHDGDQIHVDRTTDGEGLTFDDTHDQPIAKWVGPWWYLYLPWDEDPITLGGVRNMTDDEVRDMAHQKLGWSK